MKQFLLDNWGNIASVAGLLVSIGGFVWTILVATKAKQAVDEVKKKLSSLDAASSLAQAKAIMEESKRLHRNDAWEIVLDRYARARELLIVVAESYVSWTDEDQQRIAAAAAQLRTMEKKCDSSRLSDSGGSRIMVPSGGPKDGVDRAGVWPSSPAFV